MKAQDYLKKFFDRLLPGLGDFFIGILRLIFVDALQDIREFFGKHLKSSKNNRQKASTILVGLMMIVFFIYGIVGIYKDGEKWLNQDYYEKVIHENYEIQIKEFFDKYNERYAARDCGFMREVAADEAMFDKYGNTSYPKNYSCENFYNIQDKKRYPIKINPIQQNGDKHRVQGEAIVLKKNQGEPYYIDVIYFELRKKTGRDLRHFNAVKAENRRIPARLNTNEF